LKRETLRPPARHSSLLSQDAARYHWAEMMDAIKQKLARAFAGVLDSEMEVVYVLVEIRKYLEQSTELRNRHPALNFYCCWAVHSEAAGNGADRILERFDRLYPLMKSGLNTEQTQEIFRTLTLGKLKEELICFLDALGVESSIKTSPAHWLKFLRAYASITEDCPFVLSGNSTLKLRNIDSIVVETVPLPAVAPPEVIFSTVWILKNGTKILGEYGTNFTDPSFAIPTELPQ
jgi:hypothetical protein